MSRTGVEMGRGCDQNRKKRTKNSIGLSVNNIGEKMWWASVEGVVGEEGPVQAGGERHWKGRVAQRAGRQWTHQYKTVGENAVMDNDNATQEPILHFPKFCVWEWFIYY